MISYFRTDTPQAALDKGFMAARRGVPREQTPRTYSKALVRQWLAGWDAATKATRP